MIVVQPWAAWKITNLTLKDWDKKGSHLLDYNFKILGMAEGRLICEQVPNDNLSNHYGVQPILNSWADYAWSVFIGQPIGPAPIGFSASQKAVATFYVGEYDHKNVEHPFPDPMKKARQMFGINL